MISEWSDDELDEAYNRECELLSQHPRVGAVCPSLASKAEFAEPLVAVKALFSDSELALMIPTTTADEFYKELRDPSGEKIFWVHNNASLNSQIQNIPFEILSEVAEVAYVDWYPERVSEFPAHLEFSDDRSAEILKGSELTSEETDAWEAIAELIFAFSWKISIQMIPGQGTAIFFDAYISWGQSGDTLVLVGPITNIDLAGRILRYLCWSWYSWTNEFSPEEPEHQVLLDQLYAYLPSDKKATF